MKTPEEIRSSAFCPHGAIARAGAAGDASALPLAGLAFAAKDLFDVRGYTPGCGNPDWLRSHAPAQDDAPCIAALLGAGARLCGMTVMDELAFSLAGKNAHYGAPINPAAPECVCGGSSSGSASAVAGGLCDFALGTDTGGSVRVPSSYCGLYGLRPTHDRIPLEGLMPLAPSFDTIGWFARDAAVLARVGRVLLPDFQTPPPAGRLLLARDAFAELDPIAREMLEPEIERIGRVLGLPIEEATLVPDGFDAPYWAFRRLQGREVWACHGEFVDRVTPRFGPGVRERFEAARALAASEEHLSDDRATRRAVADHLAALLTPKTLLLAPPAAGTAPQLDVPEGALEEFRARTLRLTVPAGLAGIPQLALPAARIAGRPLGLSLCAARGGDEALLAAAERLSA